MLGLVILLFGVLPPDLDDRASMPAAVQAKADLTATEIIEKAHKAAGGENFVRPGTLFLRGYNIIRTESGGEILWDRYAMWRAFAAKKNDAHGASGRVRIEAWSDEELSLLLAFDGETTWTKDGPMQDQSAGNLWKSSFGFGAIRHALDVGWEQTRRPDRLIDGVPTYLVALSDPSGGETLFGIRQADYAITYVGFDTPRGWHERRYSDFFEKPGVAWRQAGRVRLYYNGIKSNEAVWTDFEVGKPVDQAIFRAETPPKKPTF